MQKYIDKVIDGKPVFGKDLKYVLALTLLLGMTYSLPQVRASIADAESTDPIAQTGASIMSHFDFHAPGFGLMGGAGSSTRPSAPMMGTSSMHSHPMQPQGAPQGSSTMPRGGMPGDMQNGMGRPVPPQDVISALYKAGYISADNLDAARALIASLREGSSTPQMPPQAFPSQQ